MYVLREQFADLLKICMHFRQGHKQICVIIFCVSISTRALIKQMGMMMMTESRQSDKGIK